MARRGFAVVFTLLGAAVAVSVAAFLALYLIVGREPAVPSHATLVLPIGGDLAETTPDDVVSYLNRSRHADRPGDRRESAEGQGRRAHRRAFC